MAKQKVTVEVEVPEGWELTGELRPFQPGDWCISHAGTPLLITGDEFWYKDLLYQKRVDLAPQGLILRKVRTPQVGEVWASRPRGIVHILILPGNLALTISGPFGGEADPFPIVTDYWHYAFPSTKEWAESLKGEGGK